MTREGIEPSQKHEGQKKEVLGVTREGIEPPEARGAKERGVKTHTLEGLVCVFCLCGKGMSLHSLMTFPNESILLLPMYIF